MQLYGPGKLQNVDAFCCLVLLPAKPATPQKYLDMFGTLMLSGLYSFYRLFPIVGNSL